MNKCCKPCTCFAAYAQLSPCMHDTSTCSGHLPSLLMQVPSAWPVMPWKALFPEVCMDCNAGIILQLRSWSLHDICKSVFPHNLTCANVLRWQSESLPWSVITCMRHAVRSASNGSSAVTPSWRRASANELCLAFGGPSKSLLWSVTMSMRHIVRSVSRSSSAVTLTWQRAPANELCLPFRWPSGSLPWSVTMSMRHAVRNDLRS